MKQPTERRSTPSWFAMIWIAGNPARATDACRVFCLSTPLCVTVTSTTYVYTGGVETGVCVRLFAYPRFPESDQTLSDKAGKLAEFLRVKLCQSSFSIEYPTLTHWTSYRRD